MLKIFIKPWVTLTPTRETHDPLPWVGVLTGRVRVGLVDPRVTRGNPYLASTHLSGSLFLIRDYHGFGNPCGLQVAYTGVGVRVAFL